MTPNELWALFQHTAARRRLELPPIGSDLVISFNTQPPEGGWLKNARNFCVLACFNTQPPEGGWQTARPSMLYRPGFNTQPPEGGWVKGIWTI